jgi:4-hydroxy-4-methyl-2-oxoglutarate aldolase
MEKIMSASTGSAGSMIEYLKTVDSPTLSNAIEFLKVRPLQEGFTPCELRCLFPEFGRMCGWAVTAQVETISETYPHDPAAFPALFQAVIDSPKPAVVVYQEIGARPEFAAHSGEVICSIVKRLGAVGLVTDAAVRDIPEVRALGFHYFARGAAVSHGHFRVVRVGVPVQIMGVAIRNGDLVHGDENGLLSVPKEQLNELPALVDKVRAKESKLLEFVRGPQFNIEETLRLLFH